MIFKNILQEFKFFPTIYDIILVLNLDKLILYFLNNLVGENNISK